MNEQVGQIQSATLLAGIPSALLSVVCFSVCQFSQKDSFRINLIE